MLQDQIMVLTQTLSTVTQFINNFSGYISNTTACTLQDPLCDFCLNADTCKICKEVRRIGDLSIRRNFSLIAGRVCLICRAVSPSQEAHTATCRSRKLLSTSCYWQSWPRCNPLENNLLQVMHSWDLTDLALSKCVN